MVSKLEQLARGEIKFLSMRDYLIGLEQEQKDKKARERELRDPGGLKRAAYLRKLHREPLLQRAESILGWSAGLLIGELRAVGPDDEGAFERLARRILRKCKQIDGSNAEKRRKAYFKACIANRSKPEADCEGPDSVEALASKAGLTQRAAAREIEKVRAAMSWRLDHDETEAEIAERANAMAEKAALKNHPLRFLSIVVQNEHRASRRHRKREGAYE